MPSKATERLMDAIMRGDTGALELFKEAADQKQRDLTPKGKDSYVIPSLLNDDHASAIKVYDFLNKALGEDWYDWEIETIERILFVKYGAALESVNRDKVLAIRHTCRSDASFYDWFEFNQVSLAFSGCMADFDALRSPSPGMVINAVKTLNHIRPDREKSFGQDVLKYICIVLVNDGIYTPPNSIAAIIFEELKNFVSPKTVAEWPSITARYKEIVVNDKRDIEDDLIDVQARRLIKAEGAALEYSK